ncbi:hypothetical protein DRB05_21550 [Pseudoalteromonas sp. A757]|nr:hypothetical protein DRB05_21550 [Pseudoalteromonas sp. A757]
MVFGDARSIVCRLLIKVSKYLNRKVYFVDDGLYLISYVNKLRSVPCFLYTSLPIVPFDGDVFSVINNEIELFEYYEEKSSVSFIGQHLVELGFINNEDYLKVLENIKENFEPQYKQFNYYAHRSESEVKLSKIKLLGYRVFRLNCSIEQYFYKGRASKGVFISYYSTALLNISSAHKNSDFYFCVDYLDVKDETVSDSIKLSYEVFNRAGIKELSLI